jgi:hypothetical protein
VAAEKEIQADNYSAVSVTTTVHWSPLVESHEHFQNKLGLWLEVHTVNLDGRPFEDRAIKMYW